MDPQIDADERRFFENPAMVFSKSAFICEEEEGMSGGWRAGEPVNLRINSNRRRFGQLHRPLELRGLLLDSKMVRVQLRDPPHVVFR